MPVELESEERIKIPENVSVEKQDDELRVSGENGEIVKRFSHPVIEIEIDEKEVVLKVYRPSKKAKALQKTYKSHINNMIQGAQEDFVYKLKILYSHFPMEVTSEQDKVVIKNFVGENKPRNAKIVGSTEAEVDGNQIIVRGPDKEAVAQTAANIESTTKISKADPRVFQDGIYITEKAGKPLS
ncbi:MAG: 50S ribosomal protein L6 [Candidatus Thermoplasmatota archaeon]|nr:50S ribosomal protein L6 [Candidatus Thermoplasmatota archaeon]MBS3789858.1 50S ribosomal protein L6 [Candidatus Thermoplasmatota archaeon]